jgi:hypothetical protein
MLKLLGMKNPSSFGMIWEFPKTVSIICLAKITGGDQPVPQAPVVHALKCFMILGSHRVLRNVDLDAPVENTLKSGMMSL